MEITLNSEPAFEENDLQDNFAYLHHECLQVGVIDITNSSLVLRDVFIASVESPG